MKDMNNSDEKTSPRQLDPLTQVEMTIMRGAIVTLTAELRLCRAVISAIDDQKESIDIHRYRLAREALSNFDRVHKR